MRYILLIMFLVSSVYADSWAIDQKIAEAREQSKKNAQKRHANKNKKIAEDRKRKAEEYKIYKKSAIDFIKALPVEQVKEIVYGNHSGLAIPQSITKESAKHHVIVYCFSDGVLSDERLDAHSQYIKMIDDVLAKHEEVYMINVERYENSTWQGHKILFDLGPVKILTRFNINYVSWQHVQHLESYLEDNKAINLLIPTAQVQK